MSNKIKVSVTAATVISILGLGFTAGYEGFRSKPYPDVGGVPTVAYGNTVHPDGRKVKLTDAPVSQKQGMEYLKIHYSKDAKIFNSSLKGISLSQDEYDLYADFTYQFGTGAWSGSSMLKNLKAGKYVSACNALVGWRFSRIMKNGKLVKSDCRLPENWGPKGCKGVWVRQEARIKKCLNAN